MPLSRPQRGAALATVLLVSAVLLLVCLSIGTLSVLNLNMARSFYSTTQARALAMAAVSQVSSEMDIFQKQVTGSPLDRPEPHLNLIERFRRPVFSKGAEHLPGEASVTFDTTTDHYSVDNLDSPFPAAGWTDQGTSNKSVPPFSVSLVVGVDVSGQKTWFEAILRRRWPYVLCTPGRITMMGTPDFSTLDPDTREVLAANPTVVKGPVYSLLDPTFDDEEERPTFDFTRRPKDGEGLDLLPPEPPEPEDTISVGQDIYQQVFQFVPQNLAAVTVGGRITMNIENYRGRSYDDILIRSDGNTLAGRLDMMGGMEEALTVAADNLQVGGVRGEIQPADLQARLMRLFQVEEPSDCTVLEPAPPVDPNVEEKPPNRLPDDPTRPAQAPAQVTPPPAGGVAPPLTRGKRFYFLRQDLILGRKGAAGFGEDKSSRFLIPCAAGNRWLVKKEGGEEEVEESGAGIELNNALLYVKGNLDLSATSGEHAKIPTLRGTNSTIIVDGTLVLTNGAVDARDQGMVIYAKRLVSQARGHYKGLLMVRKAAVFFPPNAKERLTISGALLCGDSEMTIEGPSTIVPRKPTPGDPSTTRVERKSVRVRGVRLWSTDLLYDARYLKALHPMGTLSMMALRQIP